MIKNQFVIFLLAVSVLPSCSNNTTSNIFLINEKNADIVLNLPTPDDISNSTINYSDLFSSVRYVTFESRPYATIGKITQIEKTNDNDYVIFDIKNHLIARYDSCGRFLNLIGERGNGKNEYIHPTMITYDKFENQIIVQDNGSKKIKFFSLEGTLVKSFPSPSWHCGVHVVDKDHLVFFFNYDDGIHFNYCVTDKDGNACYQFENINSNYTPEVLPFVNNVFFSDGSELYCRSPYSNLVYSIKADTIIPKCFIRANEGEWSLGSPLNVKESITQSQYNKIYNVLIAKGKILLSCYINSDVCIWGYYSNDSLRWFSYMTNDIDKIVETLDWKNVIGDELIAVIYPEYVENQKESLSDISDCFSEKYQMLEQITNSINPTIQICTLKK